MDKPIDALSAEERIAHYRELARVTMGYAQNAASDEQRAAWLSIASGWAALADEVERQAQREADGAALSAA
ncbi:MAG TPA: hypothetical protein VKR31_11455 [Rhizomicrobium sp.]|nr:hypothetical protein [Rhizomicrobium sp.]